MKNKKMILIFIITILITGSFTAYATYSLTAGSITYSPDESYEWNVNTVEGALNDLYNMTNNPVQLDLLWTNSKPTTAFAAQKVTLDLSKYTYVAVDTTYGYNGLFANDCTLQKTLIQVGSSNMVCGTQEAKYATTCREATVTTTGIQFSIGKFYNGSNVTSNNYAIPYHIYGVK